MCFSKTWILIVVLTVSALVLIPFQAANADCAALGICPCHVKLFCYWGKPCCWSVGGGTGCFNDGVECAWDPQGNQCGYAFGGELFVCVIPEGPCGGVNCYPE